MTENQTISMEYTENDTYSGMLGALANIEEKVKRIREERGIGEKCGVKKENDANNKEVAVSPDHYAYDAAFLDTYGRNTNHGCEEWQPNVRSICRRESKRRRLDEEDYEKGGVIQISLDAIRPNRLQPRSHFETNSVIRLADSIRRYGILQPITVRMISTKGTNSPDTVPESTPENLILPSLMNDNEQNRVKFEIIAGERRFRAAKMVGMESVPCIIVSVDDKVSAELALIENLLREDLDIFEMARAIKKLIETFHMTQEEVAKRLSLSQSAVANKLRLLRFTPDEEKAIIENHLTERHARALLRIEDPSCRLEVIEVILSRRLNVSATEAYIERILTEKKDELPCSEIKKIPIIKDIRLFYNSLDHAIELVRTAGVDIESRRSEDEGGVTIEIKIPHPRKCFT